MKQALRVGAINQIDKGTPIYSEGHKVESIALLLRGTVTMQNATFRLMLSPGDFIGITDLYTGKYCFTYEASKDCAIYLFEAGSLEEIGAILQSNKDYKGFMVKSINRQLIAMTEFFYSCKLVVNEIYGCSKQIYNEYTNLVPINERVASTSTLFSSVAEYTNKLPLKEDALEGIKETLTIPTDVMNTYYVYLTNSASREISDKIKVSTILINELKQLSNYMTKLCRVLFVTRGHSLYRSLCEEVYGLSYSHENYDQLIQLVDRVLELATKMEGMYEQWFGRRVPFNRGTMEKMYYRMIHGMDALEELDEISGDQIEQELLGSLDAILHFGKVEEATANRFRALIEYFSEIVDYNDISEEIRNVRKEITALFFYIYKKVFINAYGNVPNNKSIELFLRFGFVEERLLTKEQLKELYQLSEEKTPTYYCKCYTIYDWLCTIYSGENQPSKNEFDMDYRDYLRSLRKEAKITEQQEKLYLTDIEMKLEYEISNMFSHNMKLTNGRISTFVPILHADSMPLNIEKSYLRIADIDAAIRNILKIDFSVFHREVIYHNPNMGIQKELVMRQYVPNIILFPTSGRNAIMWQETAEKRRESSGRFCFPILFEGNLEDTMIRIIGRYRWELCRFLQGLSWNDIKNKCLTSEYCDYIQFYRRNRELSEEKKEKVRLQLQKIRNNSRESFVIDYEIFIKYEAAGALRLNKVVRQILATYCPYHVNLRQQLSNNPVYSVSMQRYERYAKTRARVLEAKALMLSRDGVEVPQELQETIAYYNQK